jgi:hypothetical protein
VPLIHSFGATSVVGGIEVPEQYRRTRGHERVQTVEQMKADRQAHREAPATGRRFNAKLSAGPAVWFWPKIVAAITAKHPWLSVLCDSCETLSI